MNNFDTKNKKIETLNNRGRCIGIFVLCEHDGIH